MLTQLYCTIDAFSKMMEQELDKKLLLGSEKSRNHSKFTISEIAPVAQLDRASDYESEGHRFDSYRAHQSTLLRNFVWLCQYRMNKKDFL